VKHNGTATHNNYGEEDEDVANFPSNEIRKGAIPLGKYQFARLTRQVFFLRRQCLAYGEGDHLRLLLLKHQLLILNRSRLRALVCGA
jgi:hypothetical protein